MPAYCSIEEYSDLEEPPGSVLKNEQLSVQEGAWRGKAPNSTSDFMSAQEAPKEKNWKAVMKLQSTFTPNESLLFPAKHMASKSGLK